MVPFTVFSNPMKKGRPFRHIYVIFGRGLISKDLIAIKKWFLTTATLVAKKRRSRRRLSAVCEALITVFLSVRPLPVRVSLLQFFCSMRCFCGGRSSKSPSALKN